jgi:4-hydroxy-tetrahydrodipicolinate reductase
MTQLPIRLIVHGLGKMGQLVLDQSRSDRAFEVVTTIDPNHPDADVKTIEQTSLSHTDALIDFTSGEAVLPIVQAAAGQNPELKIIIASSNWDQAKEQVKELVQKNQLYFLYGANFSVGTALFMRLVNEAADLFSRFKGYDVGLLDIHHRHKADMPSGTAKTIAQNIIDRFPAKKSILYGHADRRIEPDELHVNCLRLGENKGFHEVYFDNESEVIQLSQQTRDRGSYAAGALLAAKWLMKQTTPGYYTFDQVIEEMVKV